jgi:hypothetical protein
MSCGPFGVSPASGNVGSRKANTASLTRGDVQIAAVSKNRTNARTHKSSCRTLHRTKIRTIAHSMADSKPETGSYVARPRLDA